MSINNNFELTIRSTPNIYINISNTFDNVENVIKINENKYNLTEQQFLNLKNLIEKNLCNLIEISNHQTESYLCEYAVDGYAKNINLVIGEISIYVNFAVNDNRTKKFGTNLIDSITNLFLQ